MLAFQLLLLELQLLLSLAFHLLSLAFHLLPLSLDLCRVLLAGVNVPSPHALEAVRALDVSIPFFVAHSLY